MENKMGYFEKKLLGPFLPEEAHSTQHNDNEAAATQRQRSSSLPLGSSNTAKAALSGRSAIVVPSPLHGAMETGRR